jgi:hypothetical protein
MIELAVTWFMQDPLKNLLMIFGGGGVLAWVSLWLGRRRIRVRVLHEELHPKAQPDVEVVLRFEVTNIGEKPTSLEPTVVVDAVTPNRKPISFELTIQEADRQLPPHAPKQFAARATVNAVYVFCWFKKLRFGVLRGSDAIIRFRNAKHEQMSLVRYWGEYGLFRWFGAIIKGE